jgi:GxxExxY protein
MIDDKYPHSELTSRIIGCAIEVHRTLGNGFQEVIYQRALAYEFELQRIKFSREHDLNIFSDHVHHPNHINHSSDNFMQNRVWSKC